MDLPERAGNDDGHQRQLSYLNDNDQNNSNDQFNKQWIEQRTKANIETESVPGKPITWKTGVASSVLTGAREPH